MKPVILITGASQGIGEAIAKVFAQKVRGVRLALVARNARNLAKVARTCTKLGATAAVFSVISAAALRIEGSTSSLTRTTVAAPERVTERLA